MTRRLTIPSISSGDAAQSINGSIADVGYMRSASAQFTFTGTPTGTANLQVSDDLPGSAINFVPTNWVTVSTAVVTAAGTFGCSTTDMAHRYARAQWVPTAGGGTVNANLSAVGV